VQYLALCGIKHRLIEQACPITCVPVASWSSFGEFLWSGSDPF
jgi:hypothetical protein